MSEKESVSHREKHTKLYTFHFLVVVELIYETTKFISFLYSEGVFPV